MEERNLSLAFQFNLFHCNNPKANTSQVYQLQLNEINTGKKGKLIINCLAEPLFDYRMARKQLEPKVSTAISSAWSCLIDETAETT